MILVVDDDEAIGRLVKQILTGEQYTVQAFNSAERALECAAKDAPELVISDVNMPEMGGFEFKLAYGWRFPDRLTPFVFLSSTSDTSTIVEGLDLGADDYLVKPVDPVLLVAKVRAVLRRRARQSTSAFHGSLDKMSFMNILRFCELKGLTGEVEITNGAFHARVPFQAGQLELTDDDVLSQLCDLTEGQFVIASRPVDFADIEDAAVPKPALASAPASAPPSGLLSNVQILGRTFHVQTEAVHAPDLAIVTVVTLGGKTVLKKKCECAGCNSKDAIESKLREQHAAVEAEIQKRLESLAATRIVETESTRERFNRLFDQGFDRFRAKDYGGALALWDQAHQLDPSNATLQINMKVARQKIESAPRG